MMKAIMLITGGLSGGISATIAGGNFWDGFRQGIITVGLNHVAHLASSPRKFEVGILEQDIIDAKLNPYDENVTGRSGELMEKVKSIRKIVNAIKSRKGVVNVKEVTELQAAGLTDSIDFSVQIKCKFF